MGADYVCVLVGWYNSGGRRVGRWHLPRLRKY
jgi:hypothetical protein